MNFFDVALFGLATWRLSSYLSNEQGPAGIFETVRMRAGVEYGRDDIQYATNWFSSELMCQWCTSIYVGLLWSILYKISPKLARGLAFPFALSTLSILILTNKQIQIYVRHLND
jgi:hypothetical protein